MIAEFSVKPHESHPCGIARCDGPVYRTDRLIPGRTDELLNLLTSFGRPLQLFQVVSMIIVSGWVLSDERRTTRDGAGEMMAASISNRGIEAYARVRLGASDTAVTRGRASTAELAVQPSVAPDVLLRQMRSGRTLAEVSVSIGPAAPATSGGSRVPGAPRSDGDGAYVSPILAQAAAQSAVVNQSVPGTVRANA